MGWIPLSPSKVDELEKSAVEPSFVATKRKELLQTLERKKIADLQDSDLQYIRPVFSLKNRDALFKLVDVRSKRLKHSNDESNFRLMTVRRIKNFLGIGY